MKEVTKNRLKAAFATTVATALIAVSLSKGLLAESILNGKKETKKAKAQTVQVAQNVNGNRQKQEEKKRTK